MVKSDGAQKSQSSSHGSSEARTGAIQARGVTKDYASGGVVTQVLRGVDLEVPSGCFAVLCGPSGSGKTTLLNLIGALDVPDQGELLVGGISLRGCSPRELSIYRRRTIGLIFQFYNLMPTLTAQENLEIVLEQQQMRRVPRRERAREFLSLVGLEQAADKFPSQLSGGEQQRVAIARALVKSPSLVLADEPTGNLDRTNGEQVIQLMKRINTDLGITFLIVTHDMTVAREASLVIQMKDGRVWNEDRNSGG